MFACMLVCMLVSLSVCMLVSVFFLSMYACISLSISLLSMYACRLGLYVTSISFLVGRQQVSYSSLCVRIILLFHHSYTTAAFFFNCFTYCLSALLCWFAYVLSARLCYRLLFQVLFCFPCCFTCCFTALLAAEHASWERAYATVNILLYIYCFTCCFTALLAALLTSWARLDYRLFFQLQGGKKNWCGLILEKVLCSHIPPPFLDYIYP
jgi:hypothetical protein